MTQSKTKISGLVKITKKINTSIVIVSHRMLNITIFFLLIIKVASNQRDALSNARVVWTFASAVIFVVEAS